jgi:4-hydroxy-tetrahydrodipicolinate synthase
MFRGSIVAIVTPFRDGGVDEDKLRELVEFHISNGTHGIVPCGTTGESATLSYGEHKKVVRIVLDQVKGRVPVIAGSGSNSTAEALELTRFAKEVGADAALVITPYYNKPPQEGLYRHYSYLAKEVGFPMIVYNVPSRTGVDILPETIARLAELPQIVGVKEATGSVRRTTDILALVDKENFCILSGDDFIVYPLLCVGGKGVISVVANVAPRMMADLVESFEAGNHDKARELHYKLQPLCEAMFYETNPIPVKTALAEMGLVQDEVRMPLCPMSSANRERLKKVLLDMGLIRH